MTINLSDEMINTLMDAVQVAKDEYLDKSLVQWGKFDDAYAMLSELLNTTNETYRKKVLNAPNIVR